MSIYICPQIAADCSPSFYITPCIDLKSQCLSVRGGGGSSSQTDRISGLRKRVYSFDMDDTSTDRYHAIQYTRKMYNICTVYNIRYAVCNMPYTGYNIQLHMQHIHRPYWLID